MAIQHVGFAVVDKERNLVIESNGQPAFDYLDEEIWAKKYAEYLDNEQPHNGPHKHVRVLIDDGAE